ncbi:hypothetical protein TNCV_3828951 [Trichonephila clavipes]|nr:hypothetical protein TNCV_3828951 [Trichonephila clavipes]
MVWAGIRIGGCNDLHIIRIGNLKAKGMLTKSWGRAHVIPYAAAFGVFFLLMQDNARTHTARPVKNFLKLKQYSVWNDQHALLILTQSSMFGTHSNDALMQDQGFLLLSKTWRFHFVNLIANHSVLQGMVRDEYYYKRRSGTSESFVHALSASPPKLKSK